ncbi:MAG: SLBB domain-containing protein [Bacteroidales bacterium]|nr:SLBB domain-containing protein [Bacteroidales bacterium]
MIKRITTITVMICALVMISVTARAQMSDEAVIAYVENGMAMGKSQNDMARELAAKGVTQAQAERIKAKYEQRQAAQTTASKVAGVQERQRRTNDGALETTAGDMDAVAVEMADPGAKTVFGRNIFTTDNLSFAPSSNLPTPVTYVLGPGDELIIDIWGTNQATIRQTISPDGTINIPDVGVISLNGMTIKQADSYLKHKLGQIYSVDGDDAKSEIKLTLGNIRTIQVNMMGEVANPGTYYLSSLSNVYHALHRAGGVSPLGSLRNIQLIRKGKVVATVDIYDFIREGKMNDMILEEGDIINVPAYDIIVDLAGNVKRPMSYELKPGETVADVIGYASGFMGDAYTKNIRMIRKNGSEYQIFTINEPDYSTFTLMDGDALSVGAMLDRFQNRIEIKGAVYRPGTYELGNEISTVKELINKAEGLKGDAFTNRALVTREREDLTLELLPVDIGAIMSGASPDVKLVKNDVLYIPSVHDLKDLGNITVGGEVAKPGTFVYAENTTLEDAIMLAGGLLESASTVKIDVTRRIKDATSTQQTDKIAEVFTFSFKDGYVLDDEAGFVLQPYDNIYVRRSPSYNKQTSVTIDGEVVFPGKYTITHRSERISDLISKAGGVNQWAYVKGARFSRKMDDEERARLHAALEVIDSAKDSLDASTINTDERYFVGIDLVAAIAKPGSDADIVLREGDILTIPQYNNTVKVSGNVLYPNTVTYDSKMSVRDYVTMAGGYGFRSKKNKAYVIYMNGTVARARKFSRRDVEPGCEIVVPQKRDREGALQEVLGVATTASSIATMMATITNLIR